MKLNEQNHATNLRKESIIYPRYCKVADISQKQKFYVAEGVLLIIS